MYVCIYVYAYDYKSTVISSAFPYETPYFGRGVKKGKKKKGCPIAFFFFTVDLKSFTGLYVKVYTPFPKNKTRKKQETVRERKRGTLDVLCSESKDAPGVRSG
jgi:hypothetical protein